MPLQCPSSAIVTLPTCSRDAAGIDLDRSMTMAYNALNLTLQLIFHLFLLSLYKRNMSDMENDVARKLFGGWMGLIRRFVFRVLKVGPIPSHIAVIMDGNRRYAKKKKLDEGAGHDAGALALLYLLFYCYELGVKYLTAYTFSIDNFKRKPKEVEKIMELLKESITLLTRLAKHRPLRVHFAGKLQLLSPDLRDAARKLMKDTADNSKFVLIICVCYSCTDEIIHAVQESCQGKCNRFQDIRRFDAAASGDDEKLIKLVDIEKHLYMGIAPDPDILIRTGDGYRLSNFLQWQTSCSHLHTCLYTAWPEFGFWRLVWVVLNFQRNHPYFDRKKRQL